MFYYEIFKRKEERKTQRVISYHLLAMPPTFQRPISSNGFNGNVGWFKWSGIAVCMYMVMVDFNSDNEGCDGSFERGKEG